jgi:hypothetical protein
MTTAIARLGARRAIGRRSMARTPEEVNPSRFGERPSGDGMDRWTTLPEAQRKGLSFIGVSDGSGCGKHAVDVQKAVSGNSKGGRDAPR